MNDPGGSALWMWIGLFGQFVAQDDLGEQVSEMLNIDAMAFP